MTGVTSSLHSLRTRIVHFTVVCLVTWPMNESEAGVDLVSIKTSKFLLISMTQHY